MTFDGTHKEIPEDIEFSNQLLLTPSLQEMGMPKALAATAYIILHVQPGSWVDRGDKLCTYIFNNSRFYTFPAWWQRKLMELIRFTYIFTNSFTLKAPISGFCIQSRQTPLRRKPEAHIPSFQSCFIDLIEYDFALPVLLIPDDEPRWDSYGLSSFWRQISSHVIRTWDHNIHNTGSVGDYKRVTLGNALDSDRYNIGTVGDELDLDESDIIQAKNWVKKSNEKQDPEWIICGIEEFSNLKHYNGGGDIFYLLENYIEGYRAQNLKLRRKLKHLTKKSDSYKSDFGNKAPAEDTVASNNSLYKNQNSNQPIFEYDVFISHASEDKDSIARPLYKALSAKGITVWFDEAVLKIGDSLRRKIDEGLIKCKYGVVILSPEFLSKEWPQRELDGLVARETATGETAILPIWHGINRDIVLGYSTALADKLAGDTQENLSVLVDKLIDAIK